LQQGQSSQVNTHGDNYELNIGLVIAHSTHTFRKNKTSAKKVVMQDGILFHQQKGILRINGMKRLVAALSLDSDPIIQGNSDLLHALEMIGTIGYHPVIFTVSCGRFVCYEHNIQAGNES
jgi:hypothetical protein